MKFLFPVLFIAVFSLVVFADKPVDDAGMKALSVAIENHVMIKSALADRIAHGNKCELVIDSAVDTYFQHPQDCSFWQPVVQSQLNGRLGPELLEHLQSATAGSPDTPGHIPQIPPQQGQNGQNGQNAGR